MNIPATILSLRQEAGKADHEAERYRLTNPAAAEEERAKAERARGIADALDEMFQLLRWWGAYRALLAHARTAEAREAENKRTAVYVASRASLPARGEMWRALRAEGVPINSTWIDEDGPKASRDLSGLWERIRSEVTSAERLILYVEPDDFPLKGALIEVGMAIAAGVPIRVVAPGVELEPRNCRPLGSWIKHPLVSFSPTVRVALSDNAGTGGGG